METIVSAICDEFPERLRRNHRHVLAFTCVIFYALGIPLCAAVSYHFCFSCFVEVRIIFIAGKESISSFNNVALLDLV